MAMPLRIPSSVARTIVLGVVAAVQFLVLLSITSPIVAFPAVGRDLSIPAAYVQFVVTAYALSFGALLLLGGRTADIVGRRRVLLGGLWCFALASALASLASSGVVVIAARALQGVGAAFAAPASLSMVVATFDEGRARDRALGVVGAATGSGAAVGLLLSGVLTDLLGRRAVFAATLGAALTLAILAALLLPLDPPHRQARGVDIPGAGSVTAGLALLTFGITQGQEVGLSTPRSLLTLCAAAGLLALFILIERRSPAPLMPLAVLRRPSITSTILTTVLVWAGFASLFFHVSLLMQEVLGYPPALTGLAYLPLTLVTVVAASVAARLVGAWRPKAVIALGAALIALGSLLLSLVHDGSSYAVGLLPGLLVTGVGLGLALVALQIAVFIGVPDDQAGLVAGLFNTTQEVASAVGTAVLATIALARGGGAAGIRHSLVVGAAIILAGGALGAALVPDRDGGRPRA